MRNDSLHEPLLKRVSLGIPKCRRGPLPNHPAECELDTYLVLNAGSSSIKFSSYTAAHDTTSRLLRGQVEGLGEGLGTRPRLVATDSDGEKEIAFDWAANENPSHDQALDVILGLIEDRLRGAAIAAVGHRVVHGGADYQSSIRIDQDVVRRLESLVPLAPLHQPHNLAPISLLLDRWPAVPQIACFDTAFHHSQPALARMFALPPEFEDAGVRRYGFHGLSYEYIVETLPRFDHQAAAGRTVVLHLGNGASMCAIRGGRSIASTMGFSTIDGLPMGTRAGSLDPGVLLYLMETRGMDARAIERLLYHQSGLLGVSGISSDMRTLEASRDPRAKLAIDLFTYRVGRELGSLAAAMSGLDAVVFTAGIGEHSSAVRELVCRHAAWLGLEFDAEANARHGPRISTKSSRVAAWVVPTDEERMIVRHMRRLLTDSP